MNTIKVFAVILLCLLFSSCVAYYKEPSKDAPYATLLFEKYKEGIKGMLGSQIIMPLEINGLPPNNLTRLNFHEFLVEPGEVNILVKACTNSEDLYGIGLMKFDAKAGEIYEITRKLHFSTITLLVTNSKGEKVFSKDVRKEYIRESQPMYIPIYTPKN